MLQAYKVTLPKPNPFAFLVVFFFDHTKQRTFVQ